MVHLFEILAIMFRIDFIQGMRWWIENTKEDQHIDDKWETFGDWRCDTTNMR